MAVPLKKFCLRWQTHLPIIVAAVVLLADQTLKFWIKLNMRIGDEIRIFNWFRIHFLENEGMAFGFSFGGDGGKLLLSLIRLVAIGALGWYITKLNRAYKQYKLSGAGKPIKSSLLLALSLILAGATGNMIDCAFYGIIFSDSYFHLAQLFPAGGGYAPFLHGRVVDMFYFPLIQGHFPSWFPGIGGNEFLFFRPVFNIADSAITVGFALFFITQRDFWFPSKNKVMGTATAKAD